LTSYLKGDVKESPRPGLLYWSDDGELMAIRMHDWKIVFEEQRAEGLDVWRQPLAKMRIPKTFHLRTDPFERGEESMSYDQWMVDRVFLFVPAQVQIAQWLESFREFPPRARAASFSIEQVLERFMPKS